MSYKPCLGSMLLVHTDAEALLHHAQRSQLVPDQDVVGINMEHRGLVPRLLRSASLLAALHFLRFGFAVGVLHVSRANSSPTLLV